MKRFFAPGKLLLTGEYAVLRGAQALSVPTLLGQSLRIEEPTTNSFLHWQAFTEKGELWLEVHFNKALEIIQCAQPEKAQDLQKLLRQAQALGGRIQGPLLVQTHLQFNRNWGLGSSSSLCALVAEWLQVPALPLFFNALAGSGYDVATATARNPILYQLESAKKGVFEPVSLPPILQNSAFLFLGQKQNSAQEVGKFKSRKAHAKDIAAISALSRRLLQCTSKADLINLLKQHEEITARIVGKVPVQGTRFADFQGVVKSLGAWGGDFVWIVESKPQPHYFEDLGYDEPISFNNMIAGSYFSN